MDGLPLGDLASCPDVQMAVGDCSSLPLTRPAEVHLLTGVRSAKSSLAAATALRAS